MALYQAKDQDFGDYVDCKSGEISVTFIMSFLYDFYRCNITWSGNISVTAFPKMRFSGTRRMTYKQDGCLIQEMCARQEFREILNGLAHFLSVNKAVHRYVNSYNSLLFPGRNLPELLYHRCAKFVDHG